MKSKFKTFSKKLKNLSTFKAGLIGLVLLLVFVYLGFTKFANPFSSPYTTTVIFADANQLRPASLVRVAGVNVGKVEQVQPFTDCSQRPCQMSKVTMTIQPMGLPLHKDATFAIRPRLFLEGNFFVDIHPGSPSAPLAPSGFTFPIQQGVEPVQFGQVLSSLQADTRANLQVLLQQYGGAVEQAGPSYNSSIKYWLPAYKYTAMVNHDLLGTQPHDLSTWIDKGGVVAGAFDAHPQNLKSLVSDFDTTAEAFAVQQANLQRAVHELPTTLQVATPTFTALNSIICATGSFAPPPCAPGRLPRLLTALVPGVRSSGPMIDQSLPYFRQLRALVQPSELQGLARDLTVTIPALTQLTLRTIPFMRDQVRPASSCAVNVIHPWTMLTVRDPNFNSSKGFPQRKVYVEGVDYLPGLAGESRNFDSMSPFIRVTESLSGTLMYSLSGNTIGSAGTGPIGSAGSGTGVTVGGEEPSLKDAAGGKRPPLAGADVPNYPCETQPALKTVSDAHTGAAPAQKPTPASKLPKLP